MRYLEPGEKSDRSRLITELEEFIWGHVPVWCVSHFGLVGWLIFFGFLFAASACIAVTRTFPSPFQRHAA